MVAPVMKPDRELVHIGGDIPDPMGSNLRGHQCTYNLERTKFGEPTVLYTDRSGQEFVLTVDVYKYEGAPLELILFCPRCSKKGSMHTLRITQDKKHIEYDPAAGDPRLGGRLDVERFTCTHELDSQKAVGIVSGTNLCGWTVAIDKNIARDA